MSEDTQSRSSRQSNESSQQRRQRRQQRQQPQQQHQQTQPQQPQFFIIPESGEGITVPRFPNASHRENYSAKTSRRLGIIQIVGGVYCIMFQASLTAIGSFIRYTGAGFYCGLLFIVTGGFGYRAGKNKFSNMILTYMVLCIISSVFSLTIFISAYAITVDSSILKDEHFPLSTTAQPTTVKSGYEYDTHLNNRNNWNGVVTTANWVYWSDVRYKRDRYETDFYERYEMQRYTFMVYWGSALGLHILFIITGLIELISLIWGSAIACKVLCCESESQPGALPMVVVNSNRVMPGPMSPTAMSAMSPSAIQALSPAIMAAMSPSPPSAARSTSATPSATAAARSASAAAPSSQPITADSTRTPTSPMTEPIQSPVYTPPVPRDPPPEYTP